MAPSTATPSNLHRAPTACLGCRAAKVRCLVSRRPDRCDRCITNKGHCVFTQPNRGRSRRPRRALAAQEGVQAGNTITQPLSTPTPAARAVAPAVAPTPSCHAATARDRAGTDCDQQPLITPEIRARIVAALSSLKGKRGSPFSFVTSGDAPPLSSLGADGPHDRAPQHPFPQQDLGRSRLHPATLKLSGLLRPLNASPQAPDGHESCRSGTWISMPSYSSSLTLGQTITDPIDSGMLTQEDSVALFQHFMLELNAKWEYILDPFTDTHDDVRRRSPLLFATVLFCSSKFALSSSGILVPATDAFLQCRLCSLARNLAVRAFATGDRALETMQAFYLLVCWKDPDDDISYLHSGYAFHILHDLDLKYRSDDNQQTAQYRRTWLALFRQNKQQNLFFMRHPSVSRPEENGPSFFGNLDSWLKLPRALPSDFVACCSADLRRIQSRMRVMVEHASPSMLPCLLESLDADLYRWRTQWKDHLESQGRLHPVENTSLDPRLFRPGKDHLKAVVGLWEYSVRLNVASTIFRQALMASMALQRFSNTSPPSLFHLDSCPTQDFLSADIPGLHGSVEGAFGTLRHLLLIPTCDLRRSPDSVLLLGPNAALFLCLLLCLPCKGILGPSFQKTATELIRDVAQHVGHSVQSPQDVAALHAAYLKSLVDLFTPESPSDVGGVTGTSDFDLPQPNINANTMDYDSGVLEAAHVLASGLGENSYDIEGLDNADNIAIEPDTSSNLHVQSLANLLDVDFFWETLDASADVNAGLR